LGIWLSIFLLCRITKVDKKFTTLYIRRKNNMADIYYWIKGWFWSEYFWLPPSVTWVDLKRNETTFYPDANDMLIPIPMAIGLFFIRLLWERYTPTFPCG